jgi:hypothetical protein
MIGISGDPRVRALLTRLDAAPFSKVVRFCGQRDEPGHDEVPEWRIWTDRPTTSDQRQIEACLEQLIGQHSRIFHVGVGNSGLAGRFAARLSEIRGITIAREEKNYAGRLSIPNYNVSVLNKYSDALAEIVGGKFNFIVDYNPSSFACCLYHFCQMMLNYREMLTPDGAVLTAKLGLGWVKTDVNPAWSLGWSD